VEARPCEVDTALDCSDQSLNSARPVKQALARKRNRKKARREPE